MTKDPDVLEIMEMADHIESLHRNGTRYLEPGFDPFNVHSLHHDFYQFDHTHPFGVDDPRFIQADAEV